MDIKAVIVDDDKKHQKLLKEYLEEFGMKIFSLPDGSRAMETITKEEPDIVILDIILPGRDGFEILQEIRGSSSVPVIMLSAKREDTDRIVGLELGADDYLPKPFNPRELLARIKAVLRRHPTMPKAGGQAGRNTHLTSGGLTLDLSRQVLFSNTGKEELSSAEFKILSVMMSRPERIFSRDKLMDILHGDKVIAFDRSIDMHISRLRTKIEKISGSRNRIQTVRGSGYLFTEEE